MLHWGAAEHPWAGLEGVDITLLELLLSGVAREAKFGFMDCRISRLGLAKGSHRDAHLLVLGEHGCACI